MQDWLVAIEIDKQRCQQRPVGKPAAAFTDQLVVAIFGEDGFEMLFRSMHQLTALNFFVGGKQGIFFDHLPLRRQHPLHRFPVGIEKMKLTQFQEGGTLQPAFQQVEQRGKLLQGQQLPLPGLGVMQVISLLAKLDPIIGL